MVKVRIFQDGKLTGEYDGDYAVCIVSSRKERCSATYFAGNALLKELKSSLAVGTTRVLSALCRRKGKSMEKACEIMAEFSADTMMVGAKAILDVYGEEE